MEAKKTKSFRELDKVASNCYDNGDTFFAIYSAKGGSTKDNSIIMFTGDEKALCCGFAELVCNSLKRDADDNAIRLGNAFLNAISKVLSMHNETSNRFCDVLCMAIEHSIDVGFSSLAEEILSSIFEELKEKGNAKKNNKKNGKA